MYSYEQRKIAVELYIKYGLNAATVIQKIGYPVKANAHLNIKTFNIEVD